jgi:hypothetical protein
LPTKAEWNKLTSAAGGGVKAGKKLKAKDGWGKDGNGTDEFGFAALSGGYGGPEESFLVGDNGLWWSATEQDRNSADALTMVYNNGGAIWMGNPKTFFLSVRCVKESGEKAEETEAEIKEGIDVESKQATAELEKEAKKWQGAFQSGGGNTYKSNEGKFFSFKKNNKEDKFGTTEIWTATSKMQIGNCPAKSVWKMERYCGDGKLSCSTNNSVPAKCKSITPNVITNFVSNAEEEEGGDNADGGWDVD